MDSLELQHVEIISKLQIKVNENKSIEDAQFKTFGCGSAENESLKISNRDIEKLALPPIKLHCFMFAEEAIKSAIAESRVNQSKNDENYNTVFVNMLMLLNNVKSPFLI